MTWLDWKEQSFISKTLISKCLGSETGTKISIELSIVAWVLKLTVIRTLPHLWHTYTSILMRNSPVRSTSKKKKSFPFQSSLIKIERFYVRVICDLWAERPCGTSRPILSLGGWVVAAEYSDHSLFTFTLKSDIFTLFCLTQQTLTISVTGQLIKHQ